MPNGRFTTVSSIPARISVRPGEQLDHYKIEGVAARSGMASIFRATDVRNGRQVAIKVPHPEMEMDPVLFDRFHREAAIGKSLDHPGVMKVYNDEERSQLYMPTSIATASFIAT
jgi:serine/threonine-protein kinase